MNPSEDVTKAERGMVGGAPSNLPALAVAVWAGALLLLTASLIVAPVVTVAALAALSLAVAACYVAWARPELGLLGFIMLNSSFVPLSLIDIRLPVGGLDLRDLVFMGLLGMVLVRSIRAKDAEIPWWPVSAPLLALIGWAAFSALYAMLIRHVETNWAFGELRSISYFGVFFLAAGMLKERRQLVVLLTGVLVVVDITAFIMFAQQLLGPERPLLPSMVGGAGGWRVWAVDGASGFGAVRIIPPGHVLMYSTMLVMLCLALYSGQSRWARRVFTFHFVFLNIALLLTYSRAQWLAAVLGIALIAVLIPREDQGKIARVVTVGLVLLVIGYGLVGSAVQQTLGSTTFFSSVSDRMLTIITPDETLETDSLQWRVYETGVAMDAVNENPLLGVGLGNRYRGPTLVQNADELATEDRYLRYVHNSYLYLTVKMGVPGLLFFAWFALVFLGNGFLAYSRTLTGAHKRVALALLAAFTGILFWSITESQLMEVQTTSTIGLMSGLVASMAIMAARQPKPSTQSI
jgi:O-antigen ligase